MEGDYESRMWELSIEVQINSWYEEDEDIRAQAGQHIVVTDAAALPSGEQIVRMCTWTTNTDDMHLRQERWHC